MNYASRDKSADALSNNKGVLSVAYHYICSKAGAQRRRRIGCGEDWCLFLEFLE